MINHRAEVSETASEDRVLYAKSNQRNGVTLICIAGIHGNEPAGINGLKKVISALSSNNLSLNGNFYALTGNIEALKKGIRFCEQDLNRLWTKSKVEEIRHRIGLIQHEYKEQLALYNEIKSILKAHDGPFVFIDLHTTSSPTKPFITISDSLNNRYLAKHFNVPIVLGIEEYIEGPLLTYINEFGHVSLGFEAGQHQDDQSVKNSEAFVWLVMEHLKLIDKRVVPIDKYSEQLNLANGFYEIIYRYSVKNTEYFKMTPGFKNFETIEEGQLLAHYKKRIIKSRFNGMIFMPLYQNKGNDGFFVVRKISKNWLVLSSVLRSLKFHELLRALPGIKRHPENKYCLIANKRIAFILTTKVFHLFGYRKKTISGTKIHFIKRDRKISDFI